MMEQNTQETFNEWVILELFGHQRAAGLASQATFPAGFIRLDIPDANGETRQTRLLSPQSIYCLNPVEKEVAVRVAAQLDTAPIRSWELPKLASPTQGRGYALDNALNDDFDEEERGKSAAEAAEDDLSDEALTDLVILAGYEAPDPFMLFGLTEEDRQSIADWAAAVHLNASDNDEAEVPPMPSFISKLRPI